MDFAIVIGANHHNTLGVIRSLGEMNVPVHLILVGNSESFVLKSKYITCSRLVKSKDEVLDCLIENYPPSSDKIVLFPCNDKVAELIDVNYSLLSQRFILPNINNSPNQISNAMRKDYMQEVAVESGLITPKYFVLHQNEKLPDDIAFPCITKTLRSVEGSKSDIIVCHNQEELIKAIKSENDYLIEDFIEKEYELNVLGCSIDHGNVVYVPGVIRKIREWPHKKGSSSFSVVCSLEEYGLSKDIIDKFIRSLKYEGLFSIEFVSKDGVNYFLEVNLRNDGNGYISTSMGLNLAYAFYSYSITNKALQMIDSLRYPFYFMEDFTDIKHVMNHNITFKEWRECYKKVDCFLCYNSNDPKPFYKKLKYILLDYCKAFIRKIRW